MSEEAHGASGLGRYAESTATIAHNALYLFGGQAATTALAVFFSAALARMLGAADFGLYFLITTMSTFAYVLAEWGQPLFVVREVARDPSRSGAMVGTALALRAALGCFAALPTWVAVRALGYDARTQRLAVLLVLGTLPLFLAQGYGLAFRARNRMGPEALVTVSNKGLALALALPALALGAGVPGVILAQALAGVAAVALAGGLYARMGAAPLTFSPARARELLAGGVPILAMTAAVATQPYLDAVLLSKLAPAAVVGWFGAAKTVLGTLSAPATILGVAAYPRLARAAGDAAAFRREVSSALRPLLVLGALAGTGTYLFARTAIGLIYGAEGFGPAATILEVFAPGLFLLFVDILLGHAIYASGGGTGFAIAKIASVVVGVGLNLLLIPWFQLRYGNGGIGVVVAFALSEFVVFGGSMLVLREGTLQPAMALDVMRALAAALSTILLFRLLPPLPPALGVPLCVTLFGGACLALGLVTPRDRAILRAAFRGRGAPAAAALEP